MCDLHHLLGESTASQALLVQEDSWQVHKWLAIVIGSSTKFLATNEKIVKGNEYKVRIQVIVSIVHCSTGVRVAL